MNIGFIGLGSLGTPIAENLLEKHPSIYLYNRTISKTISLGEKGGIVCNTVSEVAKNADLVFSIVSDDSALKEIVEGQNGLAVNLKPGGIHVSISTILPATARKLEQLHSQNKNHYIAAPVMGRPEAAKNRKLNFLVSGSPAVIGEIKPILYDAGAAGVWDFGTEVSAANAAKLCSNFLIASAIESMSEGIQLAKNSGIDATRWLTMLTQTLFPSPVYQNYGNILLGETYLPAGFQLKLGLKDMDLVRRQSVETRTVMPFGEKILELFHKGVEKGLGEHDWTAVALVNQKDR